ncbi:MAG TPA: EamA family transporter, partial [Ferruginibacter sp.]|nr:EamA family transporter [Ferruginibacter sp.]
MNERAKGYAALTVTSIVWGTTWVVSKIGVTAIPALQMSAIRLFIAGSLFVSYFIFIKKFPVPTLRQFRWIGILAFFMFVLANGFSTWGLQYIPTGFS